MVDMSAPEFGSRRITVPKLYLTTTLRKSPSLGVKL